MKKLIATTALIVTLALAGVSASATSAAATPVSPGACHMLETNSNGLAGWTARRAERT